MSTKLDWEIPRNERSYLRELAKKQAEYAALPVMEQRKRQMLDLNDGKKGARPPIIIETWTFDRDFLPDSVFRCKSEPARSIEGQLLRNIRNHEFINDDKAIPDCFGMGWDVAIDELGFNIEADRVKDSQGVETGYHFIHPIKDLKQDFHMLKPATHTVNRELTALKKAFYEELFQGILAVRLGSYPFGNRSLTQTVVRLMGMEAFFVAIYDQPDEVHRLMGYLRDNSLDVAHWAEKEGLLIPNNGPYDSTASSPHLTTKLPAPGYKGGPARLCDMWGGAESQETVGISPDMFHEFCFPYYRDVCQPLGLLYYGCCEPAHPFWGDISQLPHLKKISISRWCNEKFMGEALRGTDIVFSRKPNPNLLGVDVNLDEEAWSTHIRETLEAAPGVAVEFIVRDVYTVHGNLNKPKRAVELARAQLEKHYRA